MQKDSWVTFDEDKRNQLYKLKDAVGYDPGYLVVPQTSIPDVFHPVLRKKCSHGVVMTSTNASGTVIFVCNAFRIDQKEKAVDQEPFGVALTSKVSPCGLFLHHGDFKNRTVHVPEPFWETVVESGVGVFFPGNQLPVLSTGPLSNLAGTSNLPAFQTVFEKLRAAGRAG